MFSLFRKDESRPELSLPEPLADTHDAGSRAPALQADDATGALPVVPADDQALTAGSRAAAAGPNSEGDRPAEPSADSLDPIVETDEIDRDRATEWDDEVAPPSDATSRRVDDQGARQGASDWLDDLPEPLRAAGPRPRGKRLAQPDAPAGKKRSLTPPQRLLLLDSWRRSGLPAGDFAALVGISKHTLYLWNQRFERFGPEGLLDQPRCERSGARLPELTKRTILMLKQSHPEWGCQRISDMLLRGPALAASPSSVARVLHEAGYEVVQEPTRAHPDKVRRFERAKPNQLWQTDLFTFMLKRQNRRVHLVAFMDDHSRFIVSYGLHATASTALVLEALEAGIGSYGPPEEVLTDNGPQYVTWRGKSQFSRRLEQLGIRQIVARPRRPARQKTPPSASSLGQGVSAMASQRAAAILEVLAGERTPRQAAEALSMSLPYFYLVERKALQGLLRACEPQPKGPPAPSPERKLETLEGELARSRRECQRQEALVRATQRAVGLPASPSSPARPDKTGDKKSASRRRRRPVVRALRAARTVRKNSPGSTTPVELQPSVTEERSVLPTQEGKETEHVSACG